MNLEFQGTVAEGMLLALLLCISGVLCVWGAVQLVYRRWRGGLVSLSAAAGPGVIVPVLLIDSAVRFAKGDRPGGRRSLLVCVLVVVMAAGGLTWWVSTGSAGAFWMSLLGVQLAVSVGVIYSGVYANLGTGRLAVLIILRFLGIFALLLILFKPVLFLLADSVSHRPILPILVDRSASMGTADQPNLPDRYTQSIQMLRSQRKRLERYFRPVWYEFARQAARCESLGDLGLLSPGGKGTDGTDIATALRVASGSAEGAQLAGICLLSDGINNVPDKPLVVAERLGVPVFSVAVGTRTGGEGGRANLKLLRVDAPMEVVANNVTELTVTVRMTRFPNVASEVRLYEGQSKTPVVTEKIRTSSNDATVTAKLRWTPHGDRSASESDREQKAIENIRTLRVEVAPNALEHNGDDNQTELHVLLTNPKIRVLYIEGTVRPEYKYLRRLLETDPNVQFMGLVRIAENRFWAQGTIDGKKLKSLPVTDEDFRMFDVIILGDLDRSFLSNDQMARLRKFVSDGGGLLMLGGRRSFAPGGYSGTDVEAALPVVVGPRSARQETTPFVPRLTAVGREHPIFSGIGGYFTGPGEQKVDPELEKLPELQGCVTVQRPKPAAATLAVHPTKRNEAGPLIVLAVQRFGAGRSAAFTADTTWKWYLPLRALQVEGPYARFWGQMIRWLGSVETKTRQPRPAAILRLSRTYASAGGEDVKLLARVQGADGRAERNARASVSVSLIGGKTDIAEVIPLAPTATPGLYQGEFSPSRAGEFTVKLSAVGAKNETLGTDELKLKVVFQSTELENLMRNEQLLRDLAEISDGQFADISALPDLLDSIIERQRELAGPQARPRVQRLYNFPLLFVLFVILLTVEWGLRRTWQLS